MWSMGFITSAANPDALNLITPKDVASHPSPLPRRLCHNGRKGRREQTNGFQNFRMRSVLEENGQVSMVLEIECFHGIGAFEVHLSKVSAPKLSHPPVCFIFRVFWSFSNYDRVSRRGEGQGKGPPHFEFRNGITGNGITG
jgi:hypothetical protein